MCKLFLWSAHKKNASRNLISTVCRNLFSLTHTSPSTTTTWGHSRLGAIDWTPLYNLDVESSLDYFYSVINSILDDCVPKKKRSSGNSRYIYPEWYTSEIIRDIKLKAFLHKQYKASGSKGDYEAFARCRTRVKKMMVVAQEQYRDRAQSQILNDPKSFWNYAKSKRCSVTWIFVIAN